MTEPRTAPHQERETDLKRPADEAINLLEKAAWDANVDDVLVWERDERQRIQNERDGYRGALVGLLPLLYGHPEILRKRINQALAALPPGDAPQTCEWRPLPDSERPDYETLDPGTERASEPNHEPSAGPDNWR